MSDKLNVILGNYVDSFLSQNQPPATCAAALKHELLAIYLSKSNWSGYIGRLDCNKKAQAESVGN